VEGGREGRRGREGGRKGRREGGRVGGGEGDSKQHDCAYVSVLDEYTGRSLEGAQVTEYT
jgi:hypothetical protein